jgi:hypothetical protein
VLTVSGVTVLAAAATAPAAQPTPVGAEPSCTQIGGTINPDQTCQVHITTPGYTLHIGYPTGYPDQTALTERLTQVRDGFVGYARETPPTQRPHPYSLDIEGTVYRSGPTDTGTVSLMLEIQDDTGAINAAEPAISYTTFNYDLAKRAPITFDTLFKPGTTPVDVQRDVAKRGPVVLPAVDDFGVHDYQNFAVTDDAIIFFFDHDILHEDGPGKVSVPRAQLVGLLAQP